MTIPLRRIACALSLCALLASGCGGGGGSGNGGTGASGSTAALQYSTPNTFTVGQAISPVNPTVTGSVTSYSVLPALPSGLGLNATTGVISGTPSAVDASTSYTVTGATASGDVQATLTITVDATKPAVAYSANSYVFAANRSSTTSNPTSSGGPVVSWSVSPSLPAGLVIDRGTGVISGTPTTASPTTTYMVTATNSGGQATASIQITVSTATVILDTGLSGPVTAIRTNGNQIVSVQSDGTWLLQALPSGSIILRGTTFCASGSQCSNTSDAGHAPVDLAGSTLIDALSTDGTTVSGVEIRAASSGAVVATPSGSFLWYYLSMDGSYVCTATASSLSAWSTSSGTLLTSTAGNYASAAVVCAAGEMLVANGPAGSNVIQTISVSTGAASTSSPFQGTFVAWFGDGSNFITVTGTATWIYSNAAVQVELVQLPNTPGGGWGNYFWGYVAGGLAFYQIGGGASPVLTASLGPIVTLFQAGNTLAVLPFETGQVTVFNLSGGVSEQTFTAPTYLQSYGSAGSQRFVGNQSGIVYDLTTSSDLTLGAITAMAGGTSYFSVATTSGQIFSYDSSTNALVSTVNLAAFQLVASTSGTVMLAAPENGQGGGEVLVFSPASGATLSSVSESGGVNGVALSGSGTVFGAAFGGIGAPPQCSTLVDQVGGGTILCDTTNAIGEAVQISPDGTLIADGAGTFSVAANLITYIYKNGSLTTAVSAALPVAWLDDNNLLVNTYTDQDVGTGTMPRFSGVAIYNASGNLVSTTNLPDLTNNYVQVLGPNEIAVDGNGVSVPSYATLWAAPGPGAVAGSEIVFVSGSLVFAVPFAGT
jgi:hypothetical protein